MLIAERFNNLEQIVNVKCPTLFIHGMLDTLIPKDHSVELMSAMKAICHIHLSETMDHNEFDMENDLVNPISDFLKKCNIVINNDGQKYEIPEEMFVQPESLKGKQNKRSYVSQLVDKLNG